MKRTVVLLIALVSGCSGAHPAIPPDQPDLGAAKRVLSPQQVHAIAIGTPAPSSPACPVGVGGTANCRAKERADIVPLKDSPALVADDIPGYHPSDIQAAYGIPSDGAGSIAIVVPYADDHAEADLAVYRAKFDLPPCTKANGCLSFVNASPQAPNNDAWAIEQSIDLEMASASCPRCTLRVIIARSENLPDLVTAELAAIASKPDVISNSWTIAEISQYHGTVPQLPHDGIAVVAGSGDSGGIVSWPASDPSVIAVGGTTLRPNAATARGFIESGWALAGYGCSVLFARPSWQTSSVCATRGVADVSAVADPSTGVAIYDSQPTGHGHWAWQGGWGVYGGTSVATPIVAGVVAQSGNSSALSTPAYIYQHAQWLNRVDPGASVLQSGLGSPNGTAAF